jgi:MFS family permease
MRAFVVIWSGQLISVVGSGMTNFALGVWVYQRTGSATEFALIAFFSTMPGIIASPFAGALADRWNRRRMLIACDAGAGLCTLTVALLLYAGRLEVWHIYLINAAKSLFSISQGPTYAAAVSLLVPKRHLGRAGGMMEFSEAASQITAPMLAGILTTVVGLWGIILIDFATFLVAVVTLLSTRIPDAPRDPAEAGAKRSLLRDAAYGWSYIAARPGLFALLIFVAANNFLTSFVIVLSVPLVLSFASPATLGTIMAAEGSAALVGSFVMSIWGGPPRRIFGILGFYLLAGLCIGLMGLRPHALLIGSASSLLLFSLPIIKALSQAIWQSKVALNVQARVFAVRRMIAWSSAPFCYLVAGPLADRVFGPLLAEGGALAGSVGRVIGVGAGRGIGLLFLLLGCCMMLIALVGYFYPHLRRVEDELADVIGDSVVITS